jgi:hypothetical protein
MAPTAPRDSFVAALPSKTKSQGHRHLQLSGTNGLGKTVIGETLAEAVMRISDKPKINYDKCKVRGEERTPRNRKQSMHRATLAPMPA